MKLLAGLAHMARAVIPSSRYEESVKNLEEATNAIEAIVGKMGKDEGEAPSNGSKERKINGRDLGISSRPDVSIARSRH